MPLHERSAAHPTRSRETGASAGRLHEPYPALPAFRLAAQVRERDGLEAMTQAPEADRRRTHEAATLVAAIRDLSFSIDVDPRSKHVRESEPVSGLQRLEIVDALGRWRVVVGETRVERQPRSALDSFGGYP